MVSHTNLRIAFFNVSKSLRLEALRLTLFYRVFLMSRRSLLLYNVNLCKPPSLGHYFTSR